MRKRGPKVAWGGGIADARRNFVQNRARQCVQHKDAPHPITGRNVVDTRRNDDYPLACRGILRYHRRIKRKSQVGVGEFPKTFRVVPDP